MVAPANDTKARFVDRQRVWLLVGYLGWTEHRIGGNFKLPAVCRFLSPREHFTFAGSGPKRDTCLLRDAKGMLYVVPAGFLSEVPA
jgi:hypothetical protein